MQHLRLVLSKMLQPSTSEILLSFVRPLKHIYAMQDAVIPFVPAQDLGIKDIPRHEYRRVA